MAAITKAQRAALREKFAGRCAYCGQTLSEKWHADHIEPLVRNDWFHNKERHRGPDHPQRDTLANMNPACAPCNIDKHSLDLETWRGLIQRSNEVLTRDVSTFRRAVRYGLIALSSAPVVFYFERTATGATEQNP